MAYTDSLFQLGMDLTRSSTAQKEDHGQTALVRARRQERLLHRARWAFGSPAPICSSTCIGAKRLDDLKHIKRDAEAVRGSGGRDAAAHPSASLHAKRRRLRAWRCCPKATSASIAGPRSAMRRSTCSCAATPSRTLTIDVLEGRVQAGAGWWSRSTCAANSMNERTLGDRRPPRRRRSALRQGRKARLSGATCRTSRQNGGARVPAGTRARRSVARARRR